MIKKVGGGIMGENIVITTIELPFKHLCKKCDNYCLEYGTDYKDAPLRKIISDFIHGKNVVWDIPQTVIPDYCDLLKKQVNPEDRKDCFIWTGSHEEWYPYITARVVDGKMKITFK